MKTVPAILLLACGALLAQDSAPASRPTLSRAEMEADLDELAAAIREKWSYLEDKSKNFGVDLDALMASAKRKLPKTASKADFHAIVLELVAGLKDGHAGVFTLGVAEPRRRWPFRVEDAAEGFVVVERTGDAPGLGDRLLGFMESNTPEMSVEKDLEWWQRTTIASSAGARRRAALRRLHRTDSEHVWGRFLTRDGKEYGKSFETVGPSAAPGGLGGRHDLEPAWHPSVAAPGIARFSVRTFAIEDWANWLKAAPESREAFLTKTKESIDRCFSEIAKLPEADRKALIIDLRGNQGGTDLLGIHLAKHLLPKRFVYYQLSAKKDGKWSKPYGYEHDPLPPEQRFDGPLAFLIDEDCLSTTDNFLRAVVENRDDVITVGRPTNGGTGAPGTIAKLSRSGTTVTLCTMRVYGPKGGLIEGRGTVPTVPVRWTAADFLEKRDPDLAAAIEALRAAESRTAGR